MSEGQTTRYDFGATDGARIEAMCQPGPPSMMGGMAVLRPAGPPPAALGATVNLDQLAGQSTGIAATGEFVLEGVPRGEWAVDIYYLDFGGSSGFGARYVHSEPLMIEGQESMQLDIQVRF